MLHIKVVQPSKFDPDVRMWAETLSDLSVSRPSKRLSWGIPVPGDDSQTVSIAY